MLIPDRLRRVRELLDEHGSVRVEFLARELGVSAWTVRRDLAELQRRGEVRRAHGGAVLERSGPPASDSSDAGPAARADSGAEDPYRAAKRAIAERAATFVEDGSTVMLLAGSTTAALAELLARRRLTVVTNGLEIAHGLRHAAEVSVVMVGGVLHREQMTFLGPMSEASMANLHVDVIVAGAYGVHPEVGITGAKIVQAGYHHSMLRHADRLMVLADSSKIGRRGPTVLAGLNDVDRLVTDAGAPMSALGELRSAGVCVEVVSR